MKARRLNDQQGKEFHSKLINKFNKRKKINAVIIEKTFLKVTIELYVKKNYRKSLCVGNLCQENKLADLLIFFFEGILNYVK